MRNERLNKRVFMEERNCFRNSKKILPEEYANGYNLKRVFWERANLETWICYYWSKILQRQDDGLIYHSDRTSWMKRELTDDNMILYSGNVSILFKILNGVLEDFFHWDEFQPQVHQLLSSIFCSHQIRLCIFYRPERWKSRRDQKLKIEELIRVSYKIQRLVDESKKFRNLLKTWKLC